MSEPEKFSYPKSITLDGYVYTHKDILANDYASYRCKYRKNCSITLKIEKKEILKLINNNNDNEITYYFTSKIKGNTCRQNDEDIKEAIDKITIHPLNLKKN
jgi:predicted ATP-grasp superfamily ATP-dependent carboligase